MNHPSWVELGDGIRVRRSAAFQMNSVSLLDAEHTVLVDPGVLPSEIDDIARAVAATGPEALTLVFTHAHWDHVLARPWWPRARTLAHDRFAAEVGRTAARIASEAEALCRNHGEAWTRGFTPFTPDDAVSGLHFTRLGQWRVVIRDAPGHSASQVTLHLPDHRILVAADMLSDLEIPLLDGPCAPYLRTLRDLVPLAKGGAIEILIPGHGSIARGRQVVMERLLLDLDYLERLEREVGAARRRGRSKEDAREELAGLEYGDVRIEGSNLDAHLENIGFAYDGFAAKRPPRRAP